MTVVTYLCHDESGNITAVQSGPEGALAEPEGLFLAYEGEEEVTTDWYIKDGVPLLKPEAPSPTHVFNTTSEAWEISLVGAKANAWERVKQSRHYAEFSTFTLNDQTFQCDEQSQQRIMSATQQGQLDSTISITWTLADNATQVFTGTEYLQVGKALSEHVVACHLKASSLRQQIEEASTQENIDAITW